MSEKRFTKEHEWIQLEDDTAVVGITAFAQEQLGDIVSIELPGVGSEFKQNEAVAIVDSVKASSDIYCPVDGKILEINEILFEKPELMNQSPYEKGWILKIKPHDVDQIKSLFTKEEYDKFVGESQE